MTDCTENELDEFTQDLLETIPENEPSDITRL
jgi:hypothetical protein